MPAGYTDHDVFRKDDVPTAVFDWLAFSPDSNALAVASEYSKTSDTRVCILDVSSGRQICSSFLPGTRYQDIEFECIIYSPCG